MTRALVVDDSVETRKLVCGILEMVGCEVVEAADAEQALELLMQDPADLLVTDIFLPQHNGLWLTREARSRHLAETVVVVSGGGSVGGQDVLDAARAAGADLALRKPIDPRQLLGVIKG